LRKADSNALQLAPSIEMMEGISMDPIPSGLLQLGSGLLFGGGERSGMLPPLPTGWFGPKPAAGQAGDAAAAALHLPKAMSLELLPSTLLLQSCSGLLQDLDVAGERDVNHSGAPAAAWAAAGGGVGAGTAAAAMAAKDGGATDGVLCGGGGLRRTGVGVSMDVGPALDEMMSTPELQQA
jgi:hypothetical protein